VRQQKSQLGKRKNQEFLKMFFRRTRELRWIPENPAELLLSVSEQPVFVPLPPVVIDLIGKLQPKSPQYFFWTGTSTIKTAVNDWSEKMRQLYVEAGIEGKRTHEWRDTLAIEVPEGCGSLEDVQLLLGHKSR
jgi:integrase